MVEAKNNRHPKKQPVFLKHTFCTPRTKVFLKKHLQNRAIYELSPPGEEGWFPSPRVIRNLLIDDSPGFDYIRTIMGKIRVIPNVRPLAGVLAADQNLLAQVRERITGELGPILVATEPFLFNYTEYYTKEMGAGLWRQYLVLSQLRPAEELPEWKLASNAWETQLGLNDHNGRRVNIDPGYLAPGKLVLASTKDHEQRLYLRSGIYAEVTLRIRNGRFCAWDWTYPDYAQASVFFDQAYQTYLQEIKDGLPGR